MEVVSRSEDQAAGSPVRGHGLRPEAQEDRVCSAASTGDNFRNDTWTWNGTAWTEVKVDNDDRPRTAA